MEGCLDTFCITGRGAGVVVPTRSYHACVALVTFRLHGAPVVFEELVFYEAMLELTAQGWTFSRQNPSKKVEPYKPGGAKVWYFVDKVNGTGVHYLHTLLYASILFQHGLKGVFHFQPSSYYKTLLHMMKHSPSQVDSVLPNQTHSYYKILRNQNKKGGSSGAAAGQSKRMIIEAEDEGQGEGTLHSLEEICLKV